MEALNRERHFALIMGVNDAEGFIVKYNKIIEKLIILEKQYKKIDPNFKMANMWVCSNDNGRVKFTVTRQCYDQELKRKMQAIFSILRK